MERQFTVKDLFLFACLALVMILILLAMYMVDRQWSKMAQMQHLMAEQADDLRDLRTLLRSIDQRVHGNVVIDSAAATANASAIPDAFQRSYQATQQANYQPGDWLVLPFATGLKTITPLVSADAYASEMQNYVLESLLSRNPETLEWEGFIARDWQVSDDGQTFTFQLREDVSFSDGHPLDASDVVFSFDFIMNETIAAPRQRAYYQKIASVTANGPYQVVFTFKEPYFNSLALAGGLAILPQHFYQAYLEEPETFNQSKGLLMGSGPYRLLDPKGWTPDQGIVELERNPRYWGPVQPSFDRLLWKIIENDSARLTTFRNGELDVYSARPREYQKLLDDPEFVGRSQQFEYMSPTAGYSYIAWNQFRNNQSTRFADPRVRQAMTYLTDRQRIIDEIMLGYAEPAISPFSPRSHQHDANLSPRQFELEKAKQLLQAAGYEDRNRDGVLEDADGKDFEFELVYFQGSEDTQRIVLFLKDLYARAGILMKPKPSEWSVMLDLLDKKDFDAVTLAWTSGVEIDIFQMFHGSQAITGGDNFIGYKNERLDVLIDQARATVDEEQRMELWRQCERILYEDQPYTFLMRRETLAFVDRRIHNLQQSQLGLNLQFVPLEIYVPGNAQKYH